MSWEDRLQEARAEAEAILSLNDDALAKMFFESTMRRNLARTVRHLDWLVEAGGEDKSLGEHALSKLGFDTRE